MTQPFDPSQHDLGCLLTAYADGQLAPEGVQWVEQQLAERPELKIRLDEIRAVQQTLRSGLAGLEFPLALDGVRRASVLAEAGRGPVAKRKIHFHWPMIVGLAAACLTVAVVVTEQGGSNQRFEPAMRISNGMQDHEVTFDDAGNIAAVKEGSALYAASSTSPTTAAPPSFVGGDVDRLMAKRDDLSDPGALESVDERNVLMSAKDRGLAESSDKLADLASVNKGREEAVADSEMGATARFRAAPAKPGSAFAGQVVGGRAGAGANAQPTIPGSVVAGLPKQEAQNAGKAAQPGAKNAPVATDPRHPRLAPGDAPPRVFAEIADVTVATKPAAPPAPVTTPPPASTPAAYGSARRNETLAYNGELTQRLPAPDYRKQSPAEQPAAPTTPVAASADTAASKPTAQPQAAGPQLAQRENSEVRLERLPEELHKSLTPQDKLVIQDGKGAKSQTSDQQALQVQDATQTITLETDGLARGVELAKAKSASGEATPHDEAKKVELETRLADRQLTQKQGSNKEGRFYLRQLQQVEVDARRAGPLPSNNRMHDSPTNRALLAERLSVLADAGQSTLGLLTLAAGDADVVVEQAGLPLLGGSSARLFAHDLNRGQVVMQVARGAGLQVVPVEGGALAIDRPRGQLDPTSSFGYDRETFRALFGSAPMLATVEDARSTFALDAETASYDRVRAQVAAGQPIDPTAIRPEQFINAMPMDYPPASGAEAFTLYAEAAPAPFSAMGARDAELVAGGAPASAWSTRTALVAIGVVARPAGADERRPLHLTLAIDCSGSMGREGGLSRVQTGLAELVSHLRADDTVALVAFSDQARLVLPATTGSERARITAAIVGLKADGATNAVDGLGLAYQVAAEGIAPGAESRVVLASDGATLAGPGDLVETVLARVRAHRERGVSLLVVGSGAGSYQAAALERLANRADGQQVFVGSDEDAKRIFSGRLLPERLGVLAKDAKVQVTWNPQRVSHARLIGYEQRRLAHADFRNDAVDAGEISHDAQVTALYEVLLVDGATGPLGSAAVRYHDTRLQQVRELGCPLPGTVLKSQSSDRLRLLACAAETAEWLQKGWWSNVRLPAPERIIAELGRCPQPAARELENLVRRANQQNGGKP